MTAEDFEEYYQPFEDSLKSGSSGDSGEFEFINYKWIEAWGGRPNMWVS
jgi:hypothetical protein